LILSNSSRLVSGTKASRIFDGTADAFVADRLSLFS
jgi:hypothetical protein